jgi:catechol 2,3-dioxygenase-like lactoylglutathione lyase family enzyme
MSRIFGPIRQNGYVVKDIRAAMNHWINAHGVGPWFYVDRVKTDYFRYKGVDSAMEMSVALANSGDLQIELIQQRNDAPSPYVDFLASGREGLQHLAFYVRDMSAACAQLETNGLERVYTIAPEGGDERVYYYEDPRQPGTMTELIERTPLRRRVHAAILAATKGWEGAEPIRRFDSIAHFARASGLI